jgi:predicted nucleotidyltransferase
VAQALRAFLDAAKASLGDDLVAALLYGSAAEARLRPTSDVNLILVLRRFDGAAIDALREPLRLAHAAVRLSPMFLLEGEIADAASAFAAKFADVRRRRRALHGADPFASLEIPREAQRLRLQQILLNLVLRLRSLYASRSLREEQMTLVIADLAGPLRSAAATLRELAGEPPLPPKEALERLAAGLSPDGYREALQQLSTARETRRLAPGAAGPAALRLLELAQALRGQAESLR